MIARDEVLRRVRAALVDVPAGDDVIVPRAYRRNGDLAADDLVAMLVARLQEYGAAVVVTDDPRAMLDSVLSERGARRVVIAGDLSPELRPSGVDLVTDGTQGVLTPRELDGCDAVVTTCAAVCAETGTLALDGGAGQGRRAITLVPDLHVCVVRRHEIVQTVPELFDQLEPSARSGRPIVLVSGPSATSDIELARVEGVHGPRQLVVVITP